MVQALVIKHVRKCPGKLVVAKRPLIGLESGAKKALDVATTQ